MTLCDCDRYMHKHERCEFHAEVGGLCTRCLFYCFADEDDE